MWSVIVTVAVMASLGLLSLLLICSEVISSRVLPKIGEELVYYADAEVEETPADSETETDVSKDVVDDAEQLMKEIYEGGENV